MLQIKAVKTGTVYWSCLASLAYFYMVSTRTFPELTQCPTLLQTPLKGAYTIPPTAEFLNCSETNTKTPAEMHNSRKKNSLQVKESADMSILVWARLILRPISDSGHSRPGSQGDVLWNIHVALQVSAWGGYVFIINLIPLHVFVLLLMGRFSRRLYIGKHSCIETKQACDIIISFCVSQENLGKSCKKKKKKKNPPCHWIVWANSALTCHWTQKIQLNVFSPCFSAYTTFYILGLILSMQVPFVGFQPLRTSEHMAAAGKLFIFCKKKKKKNALKKQGDGKFSDQQRSLLEK